MFACLSWPFKTTGNEWLLMVWQHFGAFSVCSSVTNVFTSAIFASILWNSRQKCLNASDFPDYKETLEILNEIISSTDFTDLDGSLKFMASCHQKHDDVDARVKSRFGFKSFAIPDKKRTHFSHGTHPCAHTKAICVYTSSRPDLCCSDHWSQSSWTCPCRSVHTGSRCPTPPCPWTPQAAGSTAKPWHGLRGDSSWHGKSFFLTWALTKLRSAEINR